MIHPLAYTTFRAGSDTWVFWAHMAKNRGSLAGLAAVLSPAESERAARFRFEADRRLYIFSHGLLRMVLGRFLGLSPDRVAMSRDEHGRPGLKSGSSPNRRKPPFFNLSHSGDMAAVAISYSGSVGVDVEKIRRIPDAGDIVRQFFHPLEISRFERVPPQEQSQWFYRVWTRKEAVLKAQGRGLSYPLNGFQVPANASGAFTPPPDWGYKHGIHYGFRPLQEYAGAVAVLF